MQVFRRLLPSVRRAARQAPRVSDGAIVYAVGDVHGRADLLERMITEITADAAGRAPDLARIAVFLGDYVDRGPESRRVVDILVSDPLPGFEVTCLMGNHEAAMLEFLENPAEGGAWLEFGGDATLLSYGVRLRGRGRDRLAAAGADLARELPAAHRRFLAGLRPYLVIGDYLFVHAGIRPGVPLERQRPDDLLWIRDGFIGSRRRHPHVVVHGHTPVPAPEVFDNRIGIDTGAFHTGVLTCLVLESTDRRFLRT